MKSHRTSLVAGALALVAVLALATPAAAHAPMVVEPGNESPATAVILEDPTLSRAIGAGSSLALRSLRCSDGEAYPDHGPDRGLSEAR